MYEDPRSKISRLQKILDTKSDAFTKAAVRHELHQNKAEPQSSWPEPEEVISPETVEADFRPTKKSFLSPAKILISSIIFFLVAIVIVIFNFFIGGNFISGDNILVTVKAPISIAGGEVLPFEIEIKNNNNVALLGADLRIDYPEGAKSSADTSIVAKREQVFIGDISAGQTIKKNLSVALFGQENQKKDINLVLEYKVDGSNSLFKKNKTFSVLLTASPVSIIVSGPTEVNTNQTVDFNIEIISNSNSVIKNLLLKADYPFGFIYKSANPKTIADNNLWLIGDIEPGAKRSIKISGILSGQEGEERGFKFSLGTPLDLENLALNIPFVDSFSSVTIRRPFVSADISFNKVDTKEYISYAGGKIETLINWRNNLPYEVADVSIAVRINGNALDKSSIRADDGFYRSIDNTIIFDKSTDRDLASLDASDSGESKFTFASFPVSSVTGAGLSNPTITLDIFVKGRRVGYDGDQDDVLFSDSRQVRLTENPRLFAKALYHVGPFQNKGPIPLKAEQETTFTITWTVTNPLNNLSSVRAVATLPTYMTWINSISPKNEKISYDPNTRQITWSLGNISAGAGIYSGAKEVSFQVGILPSVSQIDSTPELISAVTLVGKDVFTNTEVSAGFQALDIRLTSDPYFDLSQSTVLQ
jgi:uncharacterized membrane protein